MLELASIYRPTKYHLPVSVTNSASPCLAAPSSVYPLRLPITIHLSYRTTSRRPAKTPQVEIRPAAHPQRSLAHPQATPVYGPRVPISTTSGFIPEFRSESRRPIRPNAGHQIRNPNAGHTERRTHRISDIDSSEIRTPDPPNAGHTKFPTLSFRHPGTCHRKAMVHLRQWGNHWPYIVLFLLLCPHQLLHLHLHLDTLGRCKTLIGSNEGSCSGRWCCGRA